MNLLNSFTQLVGNLEKQGGGALQRILGQTPPARTAPLSQQAQPDITYNPNPNTNIPYSAHSVQDAQLGNQYVANPRDPRFLGIDPARFGFPADNTARFQTNGPWASGSPIPSFMGQRYADNPEGRQFLGVDPRIFGYGPDNSQRR